MNKIFSEISVTFLCKKTNKKFSIMQRKFKNNQAVHFINFHNSEGWGVYEDKLSNGLTISETLEQEVLS